MNGEPNINTSSDVTASGNLSSETRKCYQEAVELISSWIEDETGHDEQFWPTLAEELKENRVHIRE